MNANEPRECGCTTPDKMLHICPHGTGVVWNMVVGEVVRYDTTREMSNGVNRKRWNMIRAFAVPFAGPYRIIVQPIKEES